MHPATEALLRWWDENAREMPWRGIRNPYGTWVSEIMLQQTRVDTVRDYYTRFMARFPTVRALAEAREEDVLKMWEGLGYYSRARNLHRGAQQVCEEFGGEIPRDPATLRLNRFHCLWCARGCGGRQRDAGNLPAVRAGGRPDGNEGAGPHRGTGGGTGAGKARRGP